MNKYCGPVTTRGINTMFDEASIQVRYMDLNSPKKKTNYLFFHIPYHPNNPAQGEIHNIYHNTVQNPSRRPNDPTCTLREADLSTLRNKDGHTIDINRLIIAYHKQKNIKELLFQRKYKTEDGKHASTFGHYNPIDTMYSLPVLPCYALTENDDTGSDAERAA